MQQFISLEGENVPGITDHVKTIDLPGGLQATQIWLITRKEPYTEQDRALASLLDFGWQPKGTENTYPRLDPQYQRSPSLWADNFVFVFKKGMAEPELVLGEWKKKANLYGSPSEIHGVVVAGGGNFERMANKSGFKWAEKGHMDFREVADREMFEEMKIPVERVKATLDLAVMDLPSNDPRSHGIRNIFLRWVEMDPKSSEELKKVYCVPISELNKLLEGKAAIPSSLGKPLRLVLNHDKMIKAVMHLPDTQTFLTKIVTTVNGTTWKTETSQMRTF